MMNTEQKPIRSKRRRKSRIKLWRTNTGAINSKSVPRVQFVSEPVGKGYTGRLTNCTICLKEVFKALTCVTSLSHAAKCSVSGGDALRVGLRKYVLKRYEEYFRDS